MCEQSREARKVDPSEIFDEIRREYHKRYAGRGTEYRALQDAVNEVERKFTGKCNA